MSGIKEYILGYLHVDHPQLTSIEEEAKNLKNIQPSIGLEVGKLLGLLIRSMNAKRVLEFGTCLGYSTIFLAEALKMTGGTLISVEYNKELYEETKRNIEQAGLEKYVELILGDASEAIKTVEGPFDIILQDSDKALYPVLLEPCIQLTRINGLIIADDALFKPMGIIEKFSAPIDEYIEKVFHDKRLYSTILPIGDGVVISTKLSN